jgi:hypothetical protein
MKNIWLLLTAVVSASLGGYAQDAIQLSNKHATEEAKAVYRYLLDRSGKEILSGQMVLNGNTELDYIYKITGKLPAIRGMDFIDARQNERQIQFAEQWWRKGGIPTIMWHWGAPGIGDGYPNSQKKIDIDKVFEKGTPEYESFWTELKQRAHLLKRLKRQHIPVLWRPFHELNGNWFWWGKAGPEKFKRLWITMYNYYVHKKHLNNLIWVLGYTSKPDAAWYPGREYVDIAGADDYGDNSPHKSMYDNVQLVVGKAMPVAYHECGIPPDMDKTIAAGANWSWWMEWHTSHLMKLDTTYLKHLYTHDQVITLDKIPNIVAVYGDR